MQKEILNKLTKVGCDIESSMPRFLNNAEFYERCLKTALSDSNFDRLGELIDANQAEKAFHAACALEGLIVNMGLTPMYAIITYISEQLRTGEVAALKDSYDRLILIKVEIAELI